MKNAMVLILSAVLTAAGLVLFAADHAVHARERSMSRWAAAQADVLSVAIDRKINPDGEAGYTPVVDFRFQVNGVQYQGRRLGLDREWSRSLDQVKQWVQPMLEGVPVQPGQAGGMFGAVFAALPVDKKITIYYDPSEPGNNIADRADPRATRIFRWAGLLALVLGLAGLLSGAAREVMRHVRKPKSTWVGDISRREEPALPQDRIALTAQLALDMAFDAMVRFAKGGADPRALLKQRFPSLSEPQIDEALGKARVLESVCYGTAARVRSGIVPHDVAIEEMAAAYPGFSKQTYRAALAWGLQQCKSAN